MQDSFNVQTHRFHGAVALYVGRGETVYLSPQNARCLARAINKVAKSCETESFQESTCGTFEATFINRY